MGEEEREFSIMKILIMGYYGFGNLGDEALLFSILKELKARCPQAIPMVLYPKGESMAGVETVSRESLLAILKALLRCDILLGGGGSLLQDVTSKKSLLYYLGVLGLAALFKKKVILIGQGIGPIESKWGNFLTSRILNHISLVGLRDSTSLNYLRRLNVKEKKLHLGADLSLQMRPVAREEAQRLLKGEGFLEGKKGLALSFRPWQNEEYYRLLIPYIEAFSWEHKLVPVFFPFNPKEDLPLSQRLMRDMRDAIIIEGTYSPEEILGMIKEMDILVGVRLHSLIFAAIALIPFVGISYDPKIQGFLRLMNMEVATTVIHGDGEALYEDLTSIYHNWEERGKLMEKRVNALQRRLQVTWDLLEKGLKRYG